MELLGAFIGIIIIVIGLLYDRDAFSGNQNLTKKDWRNIKERERSIFYGYSREQYPDEQDLRNAFEKYWERYCDHERRMYNIDPGA